MIGNMVAASLELWLHKSIVPVVVCLACALRQGRNPFCQTLRSDFATRAQAGCEVTEHMTRFRTDWEWANPFPFPRGGCILLSARLFLPNVPEFRSSPGSGKNYRLPPALEKSRVWVRQRAQIG